MSGISGISDFNVMDMVDEYAADNGIDATDIFKKEEAVGAEKKEEGGTNPKGLSDDVSERIGGADPLDHSDDFERSEKKPAAKKQKPGEWRPDASITDGMEEFKNPGVVMDKKDFIAEKGPLLNNADEALKRNATDHMNEMERKEYNIEVLKKRRGYKTLQIPPGEIQVQVLIAAGEPDHIKAQKALDKVFDEIEKTYPAMIGERVETVTKENTAEVKKAEVKKADETTVPAAAVPETPVKKAPDLPAALEAPKEPDSIEGVDEPPLETGDASDILYDKSKIIIDKKNLPSISWSEEEAKKIRRSRTLELNIVDGADIKFGEIESISGNAVDNVLSSYIRKANDIASPLPASRYRATFSGLTYPEIIDFTTANEVNNLDGERMKWSILFNHMSNVSIGPWEDYYIYEDPKTHQDVRVENGDIVPNGVEDSLHHVTEFEDFLRKTSYLDLDFGLWKVLCATTMDKEVITIDCHSKIGNHECGHSYDWIYSPNELLDIRTVNPEVLKEMEEAVNANSVEDAIKVYKKSPVGCTSYVELYSSKIKLVYGHISAYEYLEELYPRIKEMEKSENPEIVSKSLGYSVLTTIRAALIPNGEGKYVMIKGVENLLKVINTLNEIDFETVSKINQMMIEPYQIKFSLRDIVCPKCKNRSSIPIDSISKLLFIVARSLASVDITLKRL